VLDQRQEDLNAVEGLMDDINAIAKTLNTQTKAQGETLVKVNENIDTAHQNAVDAHEQIVKAEQH
jgi:hypothetical protein